MTAPAAPRLRARIQSVLAWLPRALRLDPEQAPTQVWADEVSPVVEVYQEGRAVVEFQQLLTVQTGVIAAPSTVELLAGSPDFYLLIISAMAQRTAGAGTARAGLSAADVSTPAAKWYPALATLAAGATAGWAELGQGARVLVVPPNHTLNAEIPALAGGETMRVHVTVLRVPVGSRA